MLKSLSVPSSDIDNIRLLPDVEKIAAEAMESAREDLK
jgi:hypothetical protein